MIGKEKCRALRQIRRQIAEQNDIAYAVAECTYQGECKGTCPKCESELLYLERELKARQNIGKAVAVVGISMGMTATMSACSPIDVINRGIAEVRNFFSQSQDMQGMPDGGGYYNNGSNPGGNDSEEPVLVGEVPEGYDDTNSTEKQGMDEPLGGEVPMDYLDNGSDDVDEPGDDDFIELEGDVMIPESSDDSSECSSDYEEAGSISEGVDE